MKLACVHSDKQKRVACPISLHEIHVRSKYANSKVQHVQFHGRKASGQGTSTCPVSLQETRQVKVFDVEEEISESEDEHDVSTRITSVDDECNHEDSDEDLHLEKNWMSDFYTPLTCPWTQPLLALLQPLRLS